VAHTGVVGFALEKTGQLLISLLQLFVTLNDILQAIVSVWMCVAGLGSQTKPGAGRSAHVH
jgi:hypothetical protein